MKTQGNPKAKQTSALATLHQREVARTLANHYHHRDAVQFTSIPMETISFEEAEDLTEAIILYDFQARYEESEENHGVQMFIRLIAGIAAYEDHEYRQMCAHRVIRLAFANDTNTSEKCLSEFVAKVNAEL